MHASSCMSLLVPRRKHFQALSSPLLNIQHFPSPEAIRQRYQDLVCSFFCAHPDDSAVLCHISASLLLHYPFQGWKLVASADMNSFFWQLACHDWEAVRYLEPFDEYEEWHLKCGHYLLTCAMTGDCTALQPALHLSVRQPTMMTPPEAHSILPVWQATMREGGQFLRR